MTIACVGDSTIYGLTASGTRSGPPGDVVWSQVGVPAPDELSRLLGAPVVNYGVSGTTASDWLGGTGGVGLPWVPFLASLEADTVVLCVGINDEPALLPADYRTLIAAALAAGKRLVCQTPNTVDCPLSWAQQIFDDKTAIIRGIARGTPGVVLADFAAETDAAGDAWKDELSYSLWEGAWTGIHPNQTGYLRMARCQLRALTTGGITT